jgi:hypothetical protein
MPVVLTFKARPPLPDRIDPPRPFDNENALFAPATFVKSPGTSHLLDIP